MNDQIPHPTTGETELTVRRVGPDAPQVARLAALDAVEPAPRGPALIAEIDGEPVAALPLEDGGRALADPFVRTEAAVALLELRASQLSSGGRRSRRRSRLRGVRARGH